MTIQTQLVNHRRIGLDDAPDIGDHSLSLARGVLRKGVLQPHQGRGRLAHPAPKRRIHGGVPKWLRERSAKPPFTGSNPVAALSLLLSPARVPRPKTHPPLRVLDKIEQGPDIGRRTGR